MRDSSPLRRLPGWQATLLPLLLAAACGPSASLTNVWTAPAPPASPASSILVISLDRNPATRRLLEDAVASELQARGASAVPSYTLFARAAPDTAEVVHAVETNGYDAVFVSHRLTRRRQADVVPGSVQTVPITRWSPWSGRYFSYWAQVYNPPATVVTERVGTESELWVKDDPAELVWSATAETIDPSSRGDVAKKAAKAIADDLAKKGLVGRGS